MLGLHADNTTITIGGIRLHTRKVVMKHVFERGKKPAATSGPNVPTWSQVNQAKDMLTESQGRLDALRIKWAPVSMQTWNPFAAPGSNKAKQPLVDRRGEFLKFLFLLF